MVSVNINQHIKKLIYFSFSSSSFFTYTDIFFEGTIDAITLLATHHEKVQSQIQSINGLDIFVSVSYYIVQYRTLKLGFKK